MVARSRAAMRATSCTLRFGFYLARTGHPWRRDLADHAHHHEFEDPEGMTPQQLAGMRWQAVEAFNTCAGLSPTARRLGIKLIACMDAKTRQCFPGEARVAVELGVHLSAIKKAKVELRSANLITWFNPGGPRHLSHYTFNWAALLRLSSEAKVRGDAEVAFNIANRRQGTHAGTNGAEVKGARAGTMEDADDALSPCSQGTHVGTLETDESSGDAGQGAHTGTKDTAIGTLMGTMDTLIGAHTGTLEPVTRDVTSFQSTQIDAQGTQMELQGTRAGTAIVPVRVPDITQDITQKDITQHNTPSQAIGSRSQAAPRKPLTVPIYYPQLVTSLSAEYPAIADAVGRLTFEDQGQAAKLLATKGSERALTFIQQHTLEGQAA